MLTAALGQGIFFYQNHPIRYVSVVGLIVARTDVPRRTILTLDDSSGATVDIVVLKNENANANANNTNTNTSSQHSSSHITTTNQTPLDTTALRSGTGQIIKIKGTLSHFRTRMQIQLERYFVVGDTASEMRFVDQRARFLVEVLSVPWVLGEEEIRLLGVRADEEEERVELERRRGERRRRKVVEREERHRGVIVREWEWEESVREKEAVVVREAGRRLMEELRTRRVGSGG